MLSERKVKVHTGKEVVDVRDPPEGVPNGSGILVCSDGTEVRVDPQADESAPPPPPFLPHLSTVVSWCVSPFRCGACPLAKGWKSAVQT